MYRSRIGLTFGSVWFICVLFLSDAEGMSEEPGATLATTLGVGIWWITETMPIDVTGLLPALLFPLSGAMGLESTTTSHGHLFLFLDGCIIARALERGNLYQRIALNIIHFIGSHLRRIAPEFMLATAFLSMWISDTATSVMMLPMGLAVASTMESDEYISRNIVKRSGKRLVRAIAYSASTGGIATRIGTPPDAVVSGSGKLTVVDMVRTGLWLKMVSIVTVTVFIYASGLMVIILKIEKT